MAFTPNAKGTAAAFGSRVAAGCVFGIVAPAIVSRAAADVGASRVFDGIALVGACVFVAVLGLVVVPALTRASLPVIGARVGEEDGERARLERRRRRRAFRRAREGRGGDADDASK